MDRIDFRSDTVTWPTPQMREAMASASVGDDVYGEDPTINALEELAAEMTGKEAGLFVSSGTMGNLVSILTQVTRGEEIIVGADSHVMLWENGSIAALGGVIPRALPTDDFGRLDFAMIDSAVRAVDDHLPTSRLIHVENSYGDKHGYPLPPEYFAAIREIADRHNLAVHMDGARLFNAAAALSLNAADLTKYVDTVTFCLSKGLCAPVGSVVCGSANFINRARRTRKSLGGGMRQGGILAAAGLISLEQMVDRLYVDHVRARQLSEGLAKISGIVLDVTKVKTNMVFFDLAAEVPYTPAEIVIKMREEANIWLGTNGPRGFRAVTHYWINQEDVESFLATIKEILLR